MTKTSPAMRRLAYMADPALWVDMEVNTGFKLDDWQRKVLRDREQFVAVEASRQSGKSTVASAFAVYAVTIIDPKGTVILVAKSERQARVLLKRCKEFLTGLSPEFRPELESTSESRILLKSGGTIEALPVGVDSSGDAIRGHTATAVLIDEGAFSLTDGPNGNCELLATLIPMVTVTGGKVLMITSAGYVGSPAYRILKEGEGGWSCHSIGPDQCPRHTPHVLAMLRETLGDGLYQREVELVWGGDDVSVVSLSAARAARDDGDTLDPMSLAS